MIMVVCHGGSASYPVHPDGLRMACRIGIDSNVLGRTASDAVFSATRVLEDGEHFNAGAGSNLRHDGTTVQVDAPGMASLGGFGAEAAIERVRNPISVAERVLGTPHVLLVADGTTSFARRCGLADQDPITPGARERFCKMAKHGDRTGEWFRDELERAWNHETSLREALGTDTAGSDSWDGTTFACAPPLPRMPPLPYVSSS